MASEPAVGSPPAVEDESFVEAYLHRLGLAERRPAGVAQLRALHAAHLERVPFENLSIHLGERISLDPNALAEKVLGRGRGGFCYELNGLFARLLQQLGYRVELLGARVWGGAAFGPPLDHLVVVARALDGTAWLADVGFGDHSVYPLPFEAGMEQQDPAGQFRLEAMDDGDWDLWRDDAVQYRIERHPRRLADFEGMCWYHQTSPRSHFTRSVVCSRRIPDGRLTLKGDVLVTTAGRRNVESALSGRSAILDAYRTLFGIDLDEVPRSTHVSDVSEAS